MVAEHDAELLLFDLLALLIPGEGTQDDEELLVVVLDLGPLAGAEHVFDDERVQPRALADLADELDVVQPIDVQPRDERRAGEGEALGDLRGRALAHGCAAVLEGLEGHRLDAALARVHQGAGRRAGLLAAAAHESAAQAQVADERLGIGYGFRVCHDSLRTAAGVKTLSNHFSISSAAASE